MQDRLRRALKVVGVTSLLSLVLYHVVIRGTFGWLAPDLQIVGNAAIELGTIAAGGAGRHAVELYNAGYGTAVISAVRSDCSCVTTQLERPILAHGERGVLWVTAQGTELGASVEQTVWIVSNSPKQQQIPVTLRYRVSPLNLVYEPPFLDYGRVDRSRLPETRRVTVHLPGQAHDNPEIQCQVVGEPFVETTVTVDQNQKTAVIEARLRKETPSGDTAYTIRVFESKSGMSRDLTAVATVRGDFYAEPTHVVALTKLKLNASAGVLRIRQRKPQTAPYRIRSIEVSPSLKGWITARSAEVDNAPAVELFRSEKIDDAPRQTYGTRVIGHVRVTVEALDATKSEEVNIPVELHRLPDKDPRKRGFAGA